MASLASIKKPSYRFANAAASTDSLKSSNPSSSTESIHQPHSHNSSSRALTRPHAPSTAGNNLGSLVKRLVEHRSKPKGELKLVVPMDFAAKSGNGLSGLHKKLFKGVKRDEGSEDEENCLLAAFTVLIQSFLQALFYSALRSSREMLIINDSTKGLVAAINNRLTALSFHMREYYWLDRKKINEIFRYKTEEYSTDAVNKFNIYPDQIPSWLVDWIPETGGYLVGNLQPAHMDFRFFTLGNIWTVISSLGSHEQNESILNLIEDKWDDLTGNMPLKICYPALEHEEWRIITGSDPKNTPWSYHNGGSWPTLLWQFTLACIKMGRPELAKKAVNLAEKRLSADQWPEYYDTRHGRFIGKQARLCQTWTIAGYLTSKMLLENPDMASKLFWNEDYELLENCVCSLRPNSRRKCSRFAARSQVGL